MQTPSIGRIVLYQLTEADAHDANRRIELGSPGRICSPGDLVSLKVTKAHNQSCVDGVIQGNGEFQIWRPSVTIGTGPGHWQWPGMAAEQAAKQALDKAQGQGTLIPPSQIPPAAAQTPGQPADGEKPVDAHLVAQGEAAVPGAS